MYVYVYYKFINNNETHQDLCYGYIMFIKHKYNYKCQLEAGGGLWGL